MFDLNEAVSRHDQGSLVDYLRQLVAEGGFRCTEHTEWAFRRVLSHIDDGWTAVRSWVSSPPGVSLDDVGYLVYPLIAPYTKEEERREAPQLGGDWPEELILAAYIYHVTTLPPVAEVAKVA